MEIYQEVNKLLGTRYPSDKYIDWSTISAQYTLTEEFMEKYADKLKWELISGRQYLSEQFIEKWRHKLNWYSVTSNQILSESFIEKYKDSGFIDWKLVSRYQRLSKEFIEKYKDKIDFGYLEKNILVQSDIGRDWFIAYTTFSNVVIKFFRLFDYNRVKSSNDLLIKVRVYYKDLKLTTLSNKIEVIRVFRGRKIMNKRYNKWVNV